MKKFSKFLFVLLSLVFFISCGGKDDNDSEITPDNDDSNNAADSEITDDSDIPNTDTDTGISQDEDKSEAPDEDTDEPEKNADGCYVFTVDGATFSKYYRDTYLGYVKDNILGDKNMTDKLEIDIFQSKNATSPDEVASHPGTYDLSKGDNRSYLNCTECVKVFQDHDGKHAKKLFFQESGTLVIEEVDKENEIKGNLTAKLVEVTIDPDTGEAVKVDGGECVAIENWEFDTGVCVPNCVGKICGGDGCGGTCGEGCSGDFTCSEDQKSCVPFECDEITLGQVKLLNDYDTYYYEAYATGRSAGSTDFDDIFNLYFYNKDGDAAETLNSGVVDLGSGLNTKYATCTECILFYEDVNENEEYQKIYFPQSGELVFEEVKEETLESKGHGHFRLVEVDEFDSFTPIPNGKCYEVKNLEWNTLQP
jgi:hypothetical protein